MDTFPTNIIAINITMKFCNPKIESQFYFCKNNTNNFATWGNKITNSLSGKNNN